MLSSAESLINTWPQYEIIDLFLVTWTSSVMNLPVLNKVKCNKLYFSDSSCTVESMVVLSAGQFEDLLYFLGESNCEVARVW